jgi:hypothetical protein
MVSAPHGADTGGLKCVGPNGCSIAPVKVGGRPEGRETPVTGAVFALIALARTIRRRSYRSGSRFIFANTAGATRITSSLFGVGSIYAWNQIRKDARLLW